VAELGTVAGEASAFEPSVVVDAVAVAVDDIAEVAAGVAAY